MNLAGGSCGVSAADAQPLLGGGSFKPESWMCLILRGRAALGWTGLELGLPVSEILQK